MKKIKTGAVYCENFYWPGHYAFIPNAGAWAKECKRIKHSQDYPGSPGQCTTLWRKEMFLCLVTVADDQTDPAWIAAILSHEAVHVWQKVVEAMGEKAPGTEQEAYAIQYIAHELMLAFEATRGPLFTKGKRGNDARLLRKQGRRRGVSRRPGKRGVGRSRKRRSA